MISPFAIDGAAPSTITNKMADSVVPNKMIAKGNHAIDGIVCRPLMIEPVAARSGGIRDTIAPMSEPISMASAKPTTAVRTVVPIACQSWACCSWSHRLARPAPGPLTSPVDASPWKSLR